MIGIALIGCGSIGEAHAACLARIPSVKLRTFCDLNLSRAADLCARYEGVTATNNPEVIFNNSTIDAVYICTQTDTHVALALDAIRAGKHIMMEKPLALSIAECRAVQKSVKASNIKFMTAFKLRYNPCAQLAREFLPHPIMSNAQLSDRRWQDDFWGNDPVKGGGNVLSQGVHAMDLLYYLHQSEPIRIYAEGGNHSHPGIDIIDSIAATIAFENGSFAAITIGDAGETPLVSKFSFQSFDGVKSFHLFNRMKSILLNDGESIRERHETEEIGLMAESEAFVHCIEHDTAPPSTVLDGVRASAMIQLAFDAIRTGIPQKMPTLV